MKNIYHETRGGRWLFLLILITAAIIYSNRKSVHSQSGDLSSNAQNEVVITATNASEVINLGVFHISPERTNWFRLETNESCAITGEAQPQFPGRVGITIMVLTTNIDSETHLPKVRTETLQTTLNSDRMNMIGVAGKLLALTPKLSITGTN